MLAAQWARAYRALANELDAIAAEERSEHRGWIDQVKSQLGPRRHCARVRARIEAGAPGAAVIGRRQCLSPEAYAEELERHGKRPRKPKDLTFGDELRGELGLRCVGAGR
jgi:hypothetical protein